jgi:hypothetical protein
MFLPKHFRTRMAVERNLYLLQIVFGENNKLEIYETTVSIDLFGENCENVHGYVDNNPADFNRQQNFYLMQKIIQPTGSDMKGSVK